MDPGRPPRPERSYAGGPAAYRGEASSPSTPRPPPPQQQHSATVDALRSAVYGYGSSSSSSPRLPPPPPPPQQQQHRARVNAPRSAVYGYGSSSSSSPRLPPRPPPPPQQQQQQGHAIQPVGLPQPSADPFGFGPPVPGPTPPPLHPQFGSQQDPYWWWSGGYLTMVDAGTAARNFEGNSRPIPCYPYHSPLGPTVWGPTSNTSQYLDAMVAQQMSAVPSWPQQPQFGPRFVPQPLQTPPTHQDWRLVEIRSELLRSPTTALEQLVISPHPEYSAMLVHQLNVGDEEMRKMVLDGFKHCAHLIMGKRQGHAVFEALLRSVEAVVGNRRYEEVQIILEAAVTPMLVSRSNDGVTSLKLLITAVASHPGLSTRLVNCFLRDRVMDDVGGDEVISHCFIRMDYQVTRSLIRHAMVTIKRKMQSPSGLACLGTCFRYAKGDELPVFQDTLVKQAVAMAMGRDSNRLVQRLLDLDHGSIEFRRRLLSRLMQHVVSLSDDTYGRFVLRQCFQSEENELQPVVLAACADLTPGDVQALVMQLLPLHRVLERGNADFPATARVLARKIQELPLHIREHDELKLLMAAVKMVLDDKLAKLDD